MTHLWCSLSQQAPQDECIFSVGDALYLPLLLGEFSKKNDWLQSGDLRIYCRWVTKFFHRWIIRCTCCICFTEIYMNPTCINTGYTYIYMHKNTCMPSCASNLYIEICQHLVVFMWGHHIGEISIRKWRLRCLHALQVPTCVVFFCLKKRNESLEGKSSISFFKATKFVQFLGIIFGVIHFCWGIKTWCKSMVLFEGFPLNSALFGLVI